MFWFDTSKFQSVCLPKAILDPINNTRGIQSTIWYPCMRVSESLCFSQLCCGVLHGQCLHRFIIVCFDATVWPANATYVRQAMNTTAALLALHGAAICHLQFPVNQSQTSSPATLKHRRILEDQAVKMNLNLDNHVVVIWERRQSADRGQGQICAAVFHNNYQRPEFLLCDAVQTGCIGPVPLIPANDMLGYDDASRPGPSARVEQILVW